MSTKSALDRAEKYLETSEALLDLGDYESSISRAYYAMFYVARELLRREEVKPKTHAGLHSQFGLRFVKTGEIPARLGRAFNDAQEKREFADYAEERVLTHEDAEEVLGEARAFVRHLAARLGEA